MRTLRRIVGLLCLPRGETALAIALGALAVGFGIALLATSGYLISRAAQQPPILSLTTAIVAVRFFGLGRPVLRYLERLATHDVALRSLGRARAEAYRHIEPLAPAELAGFRRGDMLARMTGDVDALQAVVPRVLGPPLVAVVVGVACAVAVATASVTAAVVLAIGLIATAVLATAATRASVGAAGRDAAAARGVMSAELVEVLRGAPELAVHGAAPEALARVAAADGQLARTGRRQALAGGLGDAIVVAAAGLTTAAVLAACISASASGSLDPVLIAAVALLALGSFEAVAPLVATTRELPTVLAAGGRVLGLLDRRAAVVDPEEPLPLPPGPAVVALEKVTARYPGATEPVLRGFGLVLQPGRHVALLGPSGAGKTTVTSLLLRFLDPEQGRVTIGGVDIRRLSQRDVRSTFALAGQEAHLFDSTIRENLRLARPQASDDDLWHALALAQLDEWVQTLPDGLDTFVGEEGRRLSGGQRQRLVIARALLTDAPVLLLDEPTAHLDSRTAQELVEDVLAHAGDRAVLLVTHRREGLDLVDEIVTL